MRSISRWLSGLALGLLATMALVPWFAREAADRVCFLDGGVVLEWGSPEQVLMSPVETRTREYLARFLG